MCHRKRRPRTTRTAPYPRISLNAEEGGANGHAGFAQPLYRAKLGASRNGPVKSAVRIRKGVGFQNSSESKLRVPRITASRYSWCLFKPFNYLRLLGCLRSPLACSHLLHEWWAMALARNATSGDARLSPPCAGAVSMAALTSHCPDERAASAEGPLSLGARSVNVGAIRNGELQPCVPFLLSFRDASSSDGLLGSVRW